MPKNLTGLVIDCLNDLACLLTLRRLLEICLEQLDDVSNPRGESEERIGLLLNSFLSQSEPHFEELEINLEQIRRLLVEPE